MGGTKTDSEYLREIGSALYYLLAEKECDCEFESIQAVNDCLIHKCERCQSMEGLTEPTRDSDAR